MAEPWESDTVVEEEPTTPQAQPWDQDPVVDEPKEGGVVSGIAAGIGRALNPVHLVQGLLDIQPRSGLQEVLRTGRMLRDIVGGASIDETVRKEAPEVVQQQEAITGKLGPREQAAQITGLGIQAALLTAPFVHGKLGEIAGLRKPEVAPEAMPQAPEPTISETVPPITETIKEEVIPNASEITSPESVTQPEIRPRVGEEAPLRQQGETPTEEVVPVETQEVVEPVPQPAEIGSGPVSPNQATDWIKKLRSGEYESANDWAKDVPSDAAKQIVNAAADEITGIEAEQANLKTSGTTGQKFKDANAQLLSRIRSWQGIQRLMHERLERAQVPPASASEAPTGATSEADTGTQPVSPAPEAATTVEPLPKTEVAPTESPPTVEPPKTGVSSERFTEQYGEDAPVPNTGRSAAELKAGGQSRLDNFQKTGDVKDDPYSVLTNLREGKVPVSQLADDVSLLRAEHQRLKSDATNAEGTPEWEAKSQSALGMANAIKEVAHGPASDMMRSFQEYDKPRYDNVTDFDQALREREGRESTSQERVKFKEMADDVTNTRNAKEEAINGVQKRLSKMPKMEFKEAYKSIHDQITELTKDCIL